MQALERKVWRFLRREGIVLEGETICCAVSGGADSVALLRCMAALRRVGGFSVCACHLEHGIRGQASSGDMEFVVALCKEREIPLITERADCLKIARDARMGLETAARVVRGAFFIRACAYFHAGFLATGHHMGDQAETVLLHLLRGSRGIKGMPCLSGKKLRPLLCVTKAEIEEYLNGLGQSWREDATNAVSDTPRNLLRNEVMPLLREVNPAAEAAISRAAEYAAFDEAFLGSLAAKEFEARRLSEVHRIAREATGEGNRSVQAAKVGARSVLELSGWVEVPEPLRRRCYHLFLAEQGIEPDGALLRALEELSFGQSGREYQGVCRVRKENERLVFLGGEGDGEGLANTDWLPAELALHGETSILKLGKFVCETVPKPLYFAPERFVRYFDEDRMRGLFVRRWEPGDRLQPLGAPGVRKLQDIFVDKKIPKSSREGIPLLTGDAGICWVVGVCTAEGCRVTDDTRSVLRVQFIPETE